MAYSYANIINDLLQGVTASSTPQDQFNGQREAENYASTERWELEMAEYQRQLQESERRYQEMMAAQQAEADRRAAEERKRAEEDRVAQQAEWDRQYKAQQDEIARQEAARLAAEQQAEAERQRVIQETEARNARSRAYTEGRQKLMGEAVDNINTAYSGFNDAYFDQFAQDFVAAYAPKIQMEYDEAARDRTFSYADTGNLRSSAAARSFGDLSRGKAEKETALADESRNQANSFRDAVDGQKSDAISAIFASGAVGSENLPDGVTDVGGALAGIGENLGALTQTQKNKTATLTRPSFKSNIDFDLNGYGARPGF